MQEARARLADADDEQRGRVGQIEHFADAELAQQHLLVVDGIGEERNRQQIGFRAGLFGKPMDHVERVGGKAPRQAAEQRDEFHPRTWRALGM